MRALTLSVGLSLAAVGLLGTLASEFQDLQPAISLPEALRAPPGSRVLVRGLLERVREAAGGTALASLTDCAGTRTTVFFSSGAPADLSFELVTLDAVVADYKGARELAVDAPGKAAALSEPAPVLTPYQVLEGWRPLLCHPVAFTGTLAWARVDPSDPRTAQVGVRTDGSDLLLALHSDRLLEVKLAPGAAATFIGVVAAAPDGAGPLIHVRL